MNKNNWLGRRILLVQNSGKASDKTFSMVPGLKKIISTAQPMSHKVLALCVIIKKINA